MHSHNFVETYQGPVGFGFDRETDEKTVIYYLQKFSDDKLTGKLVQRMTGDELDGIFGLMTKLMKKYLTETEYHSLFLKDDAGHL